MTTKSGMAPVHPGKVLRDELDSIGLSANALAKAIDVPVNRVTAILNGDRGITADTALRLGRYFDTTAQFWLNLQQTWQIRQAERGASARALERIVPRETAALHDAARAARATIRIPDATASAFKAIERNVALCNQLRAVERSLRIYDTTNRQLLRAFEGPLAELRAARVFDTVLRNNFARTYQWLVEYESRFQVPQLQELSRLIATLRASFDPIRNSAHAIALYQRALTSMRSPWLDIENKRGSVRRLFDLQKIGELVSRTSSFERTAAESLRANLGDWRDRITWPKSIWSDLGARAEFYADLGFNTDLTDLPAPAFREASAVANIRSEPPSLVEAYDSPVALTSNEEEALARTNKAHDWLQRLETHLRRFIDHTMTDTFGSDWPKRQLPNGKYDEWKEKEAADDSGASARPLIAYADSTDYVNIICKRDNWQQVFSTFFDHPENVRESLQRLHPIRRDTKHAMPITQDDELLLYAETKRLMQRIGHGAFRHHGLPDPVRRHSSSWQ